MSHPSRAPGSSSPVGAIVATVAAVVAGAACAPAGLPSPVPLEPRELPGFAISLPPGTVESHEPDYQVGQLTLTRVAGRTAGVDDTIVVRWSGAMDAGSLTEAGVALAKAKGGKGSPRDLTLPGPGGVVIPTVAVPTDRGTIWVSVVPCGARSLQLFTAGDAGLQRQILPTIACRPDPVQEGQSMGAVAIALTLPGWFATERKPREVILSDGTSQMLLKTQERSTTGTHDELVRALFAAKPVEVTTRSPDEVTFRGVLDGAHAEGWSRRVRCGTHDVVILLSAPDAARAAALTAIASTARCLAPGETPPVWPDPPGAATVP